MGEIDQLVIELYQQPGQHLNSVALRFDISASKVRSILVKNNIPRNPNGINITVSNKKNLLNQNPNDKIVKLWKAGKSSKFIARKLNISRLKVAIHLTRRLPYSKRLFIMAKSVLKSKEYRYSQTKHLIRYVALTGRCHICSKRARLVVDHDHDTDKVRGFLCYQCNIALGTFGDNLEGIDRVRKYLCSSM